MAVYLIVAFDKIIPTILCEAGKEWNGLHFEFHMQALRASIPWKKMHKFWPIF